MSVPYGYASWNYGYTLCPETGSQYFQPPAVPTGFVPRGRGAGARGQYFGRGAPRGGGPGYPGYPYPVASEIQPETVVKTEPETKEAAEKPVEAVVEEKEEGEIIERSIEEILKGRNAVMFCNDQSKIVSTQAEMYRQSPIFLSVTKSTF